MIYKTVQHIFCIWKNHSPTRLNVNYNLYLMHEDVSNFC